MLATSVVISTYNRPQGVFRLLESLNAQTVLPQTVVVVDQSKKDEIKRAIEDFLARPDCRLKVIHEAVQFQGLTKSRNHGLSKVETTVATFIDDDVEVGPTYVEQTFQFFLQNPEAVVVSGLPKLPSAQQENLPVPGRLWCLYRQLFQLTRPGSEWRLLPNLQAIYDPALKMSSESDYISGSNFSVYTNVAREVGFDEKLVWYSIGEDLDFPLLVRKRHPHGVWLDPDLPVAHHDTSSVRVLSEFLLTVHTCHEYYLFNKHWDGKLGSALLFAWSRLGIVSLPSLQKRWWMIPNIKLMAQSLRVEAKILRHLTEVVQGRYPLK